MEEEFKNTNGNKTGVFAYIFRHKLEIFFVLCLFHYRIYYMLGICGNIYAEVLLGLLVILATGLYVRTLLGRPDYSIANFTLNSLKILFLFSALLSLSIIIYHDLDIRLNIYAEVLLGLSVVFVISWLVRKFFGKQDSNLAYFKFPSWVSTITISSTFIFLYTLYGIRSVEGIMFYDRAKEEYGTIYSAKIVGWKSGKYGTTAKVQTLRDTTKTLEMGSRILPKDKCLYIIPELGHYGERGYFSVYGEHMFQSTATEPQLDYCIQGAKSVQKMTNLMKYSFVATKEQMTDYMAHFHKRDNRIISAVVEKRGERFLYLNATPSEDKLWAVKNIQKGEDGQQVLVMYDAKSPSIYLVIDWNPSPEDYALYNTAEGKAPSLKYMLKMEVLSESVGE